MQTINIIGNVGQIPVVKVAQSGSQYVEFQVAVYVNQNETQWYQVRVFGDTKMNYVSQFVYQGSKVFVSGTPTYWVSKPDDAQPKVGVSIMAQSVEGLSGKPQATQQAQPVQQQTYMNAYQTTDVTNNIQNRYPAQTYTQPLAPQQPVYQQPQQPMYQQPVAPMQPNTPPVLPQVNSQGVAQPQQPAAMPATQQVRF